MFFFCFFLCSGCHALCRYIQEEAELRFVGHNLKNDAEVSFATDPSDCKKPEVCYLLCITMQASLWHRLLSSLAGSVRKRKSVEIDGCEANF